MSENKGYYNGHTNILGTLVDCGIDGLFLLGKLSWKLFKWSMDGWIDWNNEDKKDLNYFYETTGTKNKLNEVPKQINIKSQDTHIVKVPTGLNMSDFEKTKASLEAYLNYDVDLKLNNGYLEITKVNRKQLPTIINYELPKKSNEFKIPFGISVAGIESISFKEEPHVLLTGSTGSGKSITLRNIITSIVYLYPNQIELVLIDFKVVELSIFKNLKQVKSYVTEVQEAKEVIANELEECKNRYKLFEELEVNNIYDYNKKVSAEKRLKYRFIVIEEFVMLTEDKKKIAMSMLKRLASISRASGQFLIITGQRFDNTVIDLVLRANIGNRLCHKMQDEANSKLILDEVGAELLDNKGRMIFKSGSKKVECQSYYISDEEVRKTIKPFIKPKNQSKDNPSQLINAPNKTSEKSNNKLKPIKENINDLSFLDNL